MNNRQGFLRMTLLTAALSLPACQTSRLEYPDTRRVDHTDNYHGTVVQDPYRWLEDDVRTNPQVAAWVEAQNKVTQRVLGEIPSRDRIRARLEKLWDYEKFTTPFKVGGRYFYSRNNGLQNQFVLCTAATLESEPRVLLDPNTWSADGTVALAGMSVSDDGKLLAYASSEAGSDWKSWRVMDVESGQLLPDEVKWTKHTSAAWTKDGKGFYYGRFDEPKEGQKFQGVNLNQKLYYHKLGEAQAQDKLVYHLPDHPDWGYHASVSEDGRYLVITVAVGTDDKYRVIYQDLTQPNSQPVDLITNFDHEYSFLGNNGPVFFFKTDLDAPRKRVIAMDTRDPKNIREVIPQAESVIEDIGLVGERFIVSYLRDATTQVKVFSLDGKPEREIQLPGIGTASGFGGRRDDKETFYAFSSFATPQSLFHYNVETGESKLWKRAKVEFDPAAFEVKQVFYAGKDGTRVPMFIAHRKGLKLNGNNPTLLYGYGGFSISQTPGFSVSRAVWMEMGGVLAVANIRGGGEYGDEWHRAGTKLRKQNTFDDFIAAGEWLVANDYTNPKKLAIMGGSNGGLLVGACVTQRPDLFGAAIPIVGVMDMLRFNKFTAGRYWVDDYGSSENAEEFRVLHAYSPYHNIKEGTRYPAVLVVTADTDDRVVPGHSFKFAAAMQHAQAGRDPVVIRIETRAGHGAGTPTHKLLDAVADEWAFLVKYLGFDPKL